MKISTDLGLSLNNKYHVELIDSTSGAVKQSGDFHNIAINSFARLLTTMDLASTETSMSQCIYNDITAGIRVGSGTATPTVSDTALAQPLWSNMARTENTLSIEWPDDYTARINASFTFPATASYVGTVTELGLVSGNRVWPVSASSPLVTRALLTDSEGQQISFNKTDLDILVITVTAEVSITSSDTSFNILKKCALLQFIAGKMRFPAATPNWSNQLGYLSLSKFDADVKWPDIVDCPNGSNPSSGYDQYLLSDAKLTTNAAAYFTGSTPANTNLRYAKARLAANVVTNESYYKYLVVPSIGYWDLTDPSVFPVYEITGINVGTGDGSTTTFANPLSYFKLNSDKIYKNGQLLTRGVDYTISNVSNVNKLPEIAEVSIPSISKVSSGIDSSTWTSNTQIIKPLIKQAMSRAYYVLDTPENMACGFNSANPLYIEYSEPVTLNYIMSGGTSYIHPTGVARDQSVIYNGVYMYLDYSLNGEDYIEVASATTGGGTGAFSAEFADVTAKYWRIRTSYNASTSGGAYAVTVRPYINSVTSATEFISLGRRIPNIVFTTPPASGDRITMDVTMDRIMKNSNYVVDAECQINFSF